MRFLRILPITLILLLASVTLVAADENKGQAPDRCQRLVLLAGGHQDVREPLTRKDEMVYFYDTDGLYSSVQARLVQEVLPLDACPDAGMEPADEPGTPGPPRAAPTLAVDVSYGNRDLPAGNVPEGLTFTNNDLPSTPVPDPGTFSNSDLPEPVTDEAVVPMGSGEPPANDAALVNADLPEVAPEPDESAFTNQHLPAPVTPEPPLEPELAPSAMPLEQLEELISETGKEEAVLVRILSCVQRGVDLDSADCRPPAEEMPKQKVYFRDPTEANLDEQLTQVRGKLLDLQSERDRRNASADQPEVEPAED